jgi:L-fuconolactonase
VPGLTLILDHAGKPSIARGDADALRTWTAAVRDFAALPNTACKLSGLVTQAPPGAPAAAFVPVAEVVLDAFGADRVMFGSDWPVCLLVSDYASVMALAESLVAGLSAGERAAVFGLTADRVYRLGVTSAGQGTAGARAGPWR